MTLQQKKSKAFADALREYEEFKRKFIQEHPDATPEEYEKAMCKKADELDL